MEQITPQALATLLEETAAAGVEAAPLLLDVREPWEHVICRIEGSKPLPMRQVPGALGKLERERPTVVICHHGIRSQQVARFLEQQGFRRVINLRGGVAAWAADVDPEMPTY
jgi:rhodanese-related sulfurtransferase